MKTIISVLLLLFVVSFQAKALTVTADLKKPISFQFSENISLMKPSNGSNVLTAELFFEENPGIEQMRDNRLEILPGSQRENDHSCFLIKQINTDLQKAIITSASNKGNNWTVEFLKHEKNNQARSRTFHVGSLLKSSSSHYTDEFELKNSQGAIVNLICKNYCADTQILNIKEKVACSDRISESTTHILKSIGINLPKYIAQKELQIASQQPVKVNTQAAK